MECTEARPLLLDGRRRALSSDAAAELQQHLATCAACRQEDDADRALSVALDRHLSRPRAPEGLRRALEARYTRDDPRARENRRRPGSLFYAAGIGGALAAAAMILLLRLPRGEDPMVTEAINDHLRVLYSTHPLEVESGGIHQVKPWFEGKVDFAPVVHFEGDEAFPLQGGSVAYFLDRKAATFVYKRRLHLITVFVFPAGGLPWPRVPREPVGDAKGTLTTERGFHVLSWRSGDLGYAAVSDVDTKDLSALAAKIEGG